MSSAEAGIIIVAILGLLAIFAFIRYRGSTQVKINGPWKIGMELEASNNRAPAVVIEDAKAIEGGLRVYEGTGTGAHIRHVEMKTDIQVTTRPGEQDPKMPPR
jgi:hypothetical protein